LLGRIAPREVPSHIPRPEYVSTGSVSGSGRGEPEGGDSGDGNGAIAVLEGVELDRMRASCRLAREVLDEAIAAVRPGKHLYFTARVHVSYYFSHINVFIILSSHFLSN
jgi:hypothetical protein